MATEGEGEDTGGEVAAARRPARTGKRTARTGKRTGRRTARTGSVVRPVKTPLAPDRLMEILESEKTLVAGRRLGQSGKVPGRRREKMVEPGRKQRRAGIASMV